MTQLVVEGTWEEIARQAEQFSGKRVRLMVLREAEDAAAEHGPGPLEGTPDGARFYRTATPEEFRSAFDSLAEGMEGLPVLPPEAFERESLYADDEELR
jgi:hypothetical protein